MQRREPLSEDPRLRRQGLARAAKEERRKREKLVKFSAGGASCSERTPDFVARDSFELRRRNARREGPTFGLTLRAARTTQQHYVALLSITHTVRSFVILQDTPKLFGRQKKKGYRFLCCPISKPKPAPTTTRNPRA